MIDPAGALLLLCAGAAAGFLTGFFGVGGGIVALPVLILVLERWDVSSLVSTQLAFGTSLTVIFVVSIKAAYQAVKNNSLPAGGAATAGAAGAAAAAAGAVLASAMQGPSLRLILGVVALLPATQLLGRTSTPKRADQKGIGRPALAGSALTMGFISSLTGVEGGLVGVPMMYRVMGLPLKESGAAASVATAAAALAASIVYGIEGHGSSLLPSRTFGYVDGLTALVLLLGMVPSTLWGAAVAGKTRPGRARKLYGVLLLAIAVKLIAF